MGQDSGFEVCAFIGKSAGKIKKCQKCKEGILEPIRNKQVNICDNCGWAKIEMT